MYQTDDLTLNELARRAGISQAELPAIALKMKSEHGAAGWRDAMIKLLSERAAAKGGTR